MEKMVHEGNQVINFISRSGSGTVINYGTGFDFLTDYDYGSGSTSQKVTVPTIPVPQRCLNRLQLFPDQIHGQHLVLVAAGGPGAHAGKGAQRPARALLDEVVGPGRRGIADGERDGEALVHVEHEQEDGQAPRCHNCKNVEYWCACFTVINSVAIPGCLSRVPDPNFFPSRIQSFSIPDLGSKFFPFRIPDPHQ
jgi:hypothetical protein